MKILLVYPPTLSSSYYGLPRTPPLGVCYLAAVLLQKGHQVKLLDMRFPKYNLNYFEEFLKKYKPELVGASATTFDFPGAKTVFEKVKSFNSEIYTVIGGAHASLVGKDIIKLPEIDFVIRGEGEETLPKLIEALKNKKSFSKINGIIYKDKNKKVIDLSAQKKLIQNLDRLPFPRYDLLPLEEYKAKGNLNFPILSSRGCPYNCIFCASREVHGRLYRKRSAINVVEEIEHDYRHYNARQFTVLDDNFTFDKKRVIQICQEIIKRKLDISWECSQGIRADGVDEEVFTWMKKSGCKLVAIGVESADPKVLKTINKGESLSTIANAIKAAKKAGLIVKAFFIVGSPGDSHKSVEKSVHFFQTSGIDIPRVGNMIAYPYTPIWDWIEKNGRFLNNNLDYLSSKGEHDEGAQFETDDFPIEEKLSAFNWASVEAEKWTIRYKLISMFGEKLGIILFNFLKHDLARSLLKQLYRMKLIKVVD
ncbi:MAG: B12-binding domain-containing radical SAM protein [Patescibacteria group bacterium]|nr:B12-binding domain-containing radical SAM protein [Patescibacteria group bacterium]